MGVSPNHPFIDGVAPKQLVYNGLEWFIMEHPIIGTPSIFHRILHDKQSNYWGTPHWWKPETRPQTKTSSQSTMVASWWRCFWLSGRSQAFSWSGNVKKICEFLRRCSPSGHHHTSVISRTCSNISRTYFYDTQFFILLGPVFVASFAQSSLAGSVQA